MKKTYALCLFFLVAAMLSIVFSPTPSFAANGCSALYNGGITNQQYCPSPKPLSGSGSLPNNQVTPIAAKKPQTTKGGQTIYPAPKTKTTPSTGPEEWSLPVLFVIGGFGFLLRNKAKT
jgi:hypothetical protein